MKKSERSAPRRREEWDSLIREWKASGTTAKGFARTRDLSKSSLFYWSSVFNREPPKQAAARLLPVRVATTAEHRPAELELTVGAMRLSFDGSASPRYVAALAKALLDASV